MSDLGEAVAKLEQAVSRLEAALDPAARAARDRRVAEIAAALAGRIDAAVARIDRLLEGEE
jgi:seryl-tRNA(Sec) selenium transferase